MHRIALLTCFTFFFALNGYALPVNKCIRLLDGEAGFFRRAFNSELRDPALLNLVTTRRLRGLSRQIQHPSNEALIQDRRLGLDISNLSEEARHAQVEALPLQTNLILEASSGNFFKGFFLDAERKVLFVRGKNGGIAKAYRLNWNEIDVVHYSTPKVTVNVKKVEKEFADRLRDDHPYRSSQAHGPTPGMKSVEVNQMVSVNIGTEAPVFGQLVSKKPMQLLVQTDSSGPTLLMIPPNAVRAVGQGYHVHNSTLGFPFPIRITVIRNNGNVPVSMELSEVNARGEATIDGRVYSAKTLSSWIIISEFNTPYYFDQLSKTVLTQRKSLYVPDITATRGYTSTVDHKSSIRFFRDGGEL